MNSTKEYEVAYIHNKVTHEVVIETKHTNSSVTLYQIAKMLNDNDDIEKVLSVKELTPSGYYCVVYRGVIQDVYDSYEEAIERIDLESVHCKQYGYKFNPWDWEIKYYLTEEE